MKKRLMQVAGSFYPKEESNILKYIKVFNKDLKNQERIQDIKALIVPHAGYVYSGYTANLAYLSACDNTYERVVVIGPSHRVSFKGVSISLYDKYETPLGDIVIDLEYAKALKEEFTFLDFNENAHNEHSTETQAPFVKHYFKDSKIIELVYGLVSPLDLATLCNKIILSQNTLLVISTDLSHFYDLKKAQYLDNICIEAIKNKDVKSLDKSEACGMIGIKALLLCALKNNLETRYLHYCTSFLRTFDKSSVVGYTSFYIK